MSSPSKKRKLNAAAARAGTASQPSRGLEYFFARQRDVANGISGAAGSTAAETQSSVELSDEELARRLQAEWDAEVQDQQQPQQQRQMNVVVKEAAREDSKSLGVAAAVAVKEAAALDGGDVFSGVAVESSKGLSMTETATGMTAETTATIGTCPTTAFTDSTSVKNTLSLQAASTTEDEVTATIPLDQNPLVFDPEQYLPLLQSQWAADSTVGGGGGGGSQAAYALLVRCFVLVNATQSRIKIVDTLTNCLRLLIEGDAGSLLAAVWLATNAISPPYESLELGIGATVLSRALKQACGLDSRGLKTLFHKHGDPGDVAYEAKKRQAVTLRRPRPLTVRGVYQSLVQVARSQGTGSVEAKQRIVDRLLQDARGGEESRYLVRTLCQHLRIGAVKTTMLIALSRAFLLSRPPGATFPTRSRPALVALKKDELADVYGRAEETVKAVFARRPNYNDLVPALLEMGVSDGRLAAAVGCGLALHVPLRPMLGAVTRDLGEMLGRLAGGAAFACEFKYDGQRAQVHCDAAGRVSLFSRHLERMTDKYPDLVALVALMRSGSGGDGDGSGGGNSASEGGAVESFILEGEVVAVDRATGALRPFQTLANRARKDVALGSITVDVCLFAFDLMYLNGQPLLDRPFRERRSLLRSLFAEIPGRFAWARSLDATTDDADAISAFFKSATDAKCEGIMVKLLDHLDAGSGGGGGAPADDDDDSSKAEAGDHSTTDGADASGAAATATAMAAATSTKKSGRRKPLLATYEPDKRLDSWLKVKKDYGATSDTLDLIPIAAWHGMGRKAKWWSPILMAVRNEETGSLEAVTKCMSGFTDAFYKANREFYDDGGGEETEKSDALGEDSDDDGSGSGAGNTKKHNTRPQKPSFVDYSGPEPDVWFEPQEVWEMAFADITLSPTYTAALGLVHEDRGLSLRFPRFLRKRDDKSIDEASTSEFLAGLYRKQEAPAPLGREEHDE